jgi:hypothetical protein
MAIITFTDVQIANNAIAYLGDSRTVSSVTVDPSALGVLVANLYTATRDEELKAWGWTFAIKRALLSVGAAPTNGYKFRYLFSAATPAMTDCLRLLDVFVVLSGSTGYGSYTLTQTQRFGYVVDISTISTIPGTIYTMIDPGALPVYAKYISEVTSAANFDLLFCEAFSIRLATKMSIFITQNPDWKNAMEQEYGFIIQRAMKMNVIEPIDNDLGNPWFGDRRPFDPEYENKTLVPRVFLEQAVPRQANQ